MGKKPHKEPVEIVFKANTPKCSETRPLVCFHDDAVRNAGLALES